MKKKVFSKILLSLFLVCVSAVAITVISGLIYSTTVKLDKTKLSLSDVAIGIYDGENELVSSNVGKVGIDDIPSNLKNAFIASEDKRFYEHRGLDYYRIAGALIHDLKTKSFEQGASTISCQLIKNTHLSNEKSIKRKFDEAILAKKLEKAYSKDEILETYLNVIYFGNGVYGVGNASFSFFGKDPKELSIAECASLSAIVANPSKYSPIYNPVNNNERKNTILKLMYDQKYITEDEYEQAKNEFVEAKKTTAIERYGYNQIVIYEACNILGISETELKQSGYKIYTYLEKDKQKDCVLALEKSDVSSSITVANNENYSIIAYAANHRYSPFTMRRNAGSIIKPFIYASAFENGIMYPVTRIDDSPIEFGSYKPKNYSDNYKGVISVREAIGFSSNVCAVKTLQSVGFDKAKNTLEKFGFEVNENDDNYALALGATDKGVTIENVVSAYSSLANEGNFCPVSTVRFIETNDGKIIYMRNVSESKIIEDKTADMINDCLNFCTQKGTARKLAKHVNLCSKTGTFEVGDKNSDSWVVTYDARNTYCVWQGNLSMKKEDMISKKGSSGIDYIIDLIPSQNDFPVTKTQKQAIDVLTLDRQNQIKLASFNTPQRFVVYDYAPSECETSSVFVSPKVDCNIILSNDRIIVDINAYPECKYNVYNRTLFGEDLIATIDNSSEKIKIEFQPYIGQNSVVIVPIAKGINDAVGVEYEETIYY